MQKKKIFEKTLIEVDSPYLYAFFAAQWFFEHLEEFQNRWHFPSIAAICRFSNILQRLTVPQIFDQFGLKRCQKKRKDVDYKQNIFEKTLFCVQIGQFFEAQWVFEVCLKIDKLLLSKENVDDFGILPNV